MGGQPQPDAFGPQQLVARQGQVLGVARGTLGEQPARTADVREKPDAGFRHGHAGGFGGHHQVGAGGQAQAAAHGDAVGQDHHRLGALVDHEVQGIFFPEELVGQVHRPGLDRPGQFLEVAPGAEAPVPGPADEHQADVGRGQGRLQGPPQKPDHLQVEGVEDPGAVQDQDHQAWRPDYEDGGLCWIDHMPGPGVRGQKKPFLLQAYCLLFRKVFRASYAPFDGLKRRAVPALHICLKLPPLFPPKNELGHLHILHERDGGPDGLLP